MIDFRKPDKWFFFAGNWETIKGLRTSVTLFILSQLSARFPIMNYGIDLLEVLGKSLIHLYTILCIFVDYLHLTNFIDIIGRNLFSLTSLVGAAIGLFSLASFQHLSLNGWLPIIICLSIIVSVIISSLLAITPMNIFSGCGFSRFFQIPAFGTGIINLILKTIGFVFRKIVSILSNVIGLQFNCNLYIFLIFVICCIIIVGFVIFVL